MSGRELPRRADPDDWFADGGRPGAAEAWDAPTREQARANEPGAGEGWLEHKPVELGDEPLGGVTVKIRTLLAAGVVLLALIVVVGLAVGGVFSGDNKPAENSPTTTARTTTLGAAPTTPIVPAHSAVSVTPPASTLKPGDQGLQVKLLQRALARLGYAPGSVDGVYGRSTEAALTRFQKANKLNADGVLGPKTLTKLKQALRGHARAASRP